MTFCRAAALPVAALAGRAASAVTQAAKKTRLVPVLKVMTNASTRSIWDLKTFEKAFHSSDIMPHIGTLIGHPDHNLGSGRPRRRRPASTVLSNRQAIVIGPTRIRRNTGRPA